jgi:DNA-binding Lrp family transcriptional regulator
MDEVDVAISRTLLRNSRTPYSDLGKDLGLTPQAVHKRVQAMMDAGIIRGMVARLTPQAMGRIWVLVFGWSRSSSMKDFVEKMSRHDGTVIVFLASGNFVYVHGMVQDTHQLADFVTYVQREGLMADVQVGVVPTPPPSPEGSLSLLDLKLISALQRDARKPIADVAKELGTTSKTAKRRLDRMVSEGLVNLSILWQPDLMGDTMTYLHLHLQPEAERDKVALLLVKKYSAGMLASYAFSNLPNQLMVMYWTRSVREMQKTCSELEGEGCFASVVPNVLRSVHYFEEKERLRVEELLKRARSGMK